jgi:dienelactone hydrolase
MSCTRIPTLRSLLTVVTALALMAATSASAGTLVEFPNLPDQQPQRLFGYLARPDGGLSAIAGGASANTAPYPAVVVLHGCSGISSHSAAISDRLGSWGYVALTIDTLGSRGLPSRCGGGHRLSQASDAYAAMRYLAALEDVDANRIAVLGQSMGGSSALFTVNRDFLAREFPERFGAAVAYYPACEIPAASLTAPVLILIGDKDEWNPADQCRRMVEKAQPGGAPIALTVYPGVHHAFDVAALKPGVRSSGLWIEYNEAATKDAEAKVRAFLATHLGNLPGEKPRSP